MHITRISPALCSLLVTASMTLSVPGNLQAQEDRFKTPVRYISIKASDQKWEENYHITTLDPTINDGVNSGGKLPLTFNIVSDLGKTESPVKGDKPVQRTRNMQVEFSFLLKYMGMVVSGTDTRKGQLNFEGKTAASTKVTLNYKSDMANDPAPWLPALKSELNIMSPGYRNQKLALSQTGTITVTLKDEKKNVLYAFKITYDNTFMTIEYVKGKKEAATKKLTHEIKNTVGNTGSLGQYATLKIE